MTSTKKPYLDVYSGLLLEDRAVEIPIDGDENYEILENKPHINNVTLSGNKTSSQLGLASESEVINLSQTVSEHYNSLTGDINDLAQTVDDNATNLQIAIDDVQDLLEQNITSIQTTLSNKANTDLTNITSSYDFVTVSNLTSNYRRWRNKRLECEGIATSTASYDGGEIALPLAYKDENFKIQITVRELGNFFVCAFPIGTQKFKVRISDTYGTPRAVQFSWETKGYVL